MASLCPGECSERSDSTGNRLLREQDDARGAQCCWGMVQQLSVPLVAPQVSSCQRPFLLGSPEAVWSHRARPCCHPSVWPKQRWPQACLAVPGPPGSPGHCPCGLSLRCVVSVPRRGGRPGPAGLSSPPTASHGHPPSVAGAPTCCCATAGVGNERWERFLSMG